MAKSENDKVLIVRIATADFDALRERANDTERTVSQLVRLWLKANLAAGVQ